MNAIIQNFKTRLPETLYLGDQNFPVSVSKSLILPLARTETEADGSLVVTDEVNQLKIIQKYNGKKCTISFYDLNGGKAELVVEYDGGKRVKPEVPAAPSAPSVGTRQFSNGSPKMYAGKLKSDIEAAYSDRDIKEKITLIGDMTPAEAVQEMSNVLTDCELPIDPVNVYDALSFFNVLVTPEEFYSIYEDINNEKVGKEDKNSVEALFRNYTINGTAKKMKRFSDKNVYSFTKQFSSIDCGDGEDETPDAEEAITTDSDEMKAPEVIVAEECDDGNLDPNSVKEHGIVSRTINKITSARDNRDIGKMNAYKDMQKDKQSLALEKEKTKQIRAQAKAKAASGEDEVAEDQVTEDVAVEDADDIKEHSVIGNAIEKVAGTAAKNWVKNNKKKAVAGAAAAAAIGAKKLYDANKKKKAQQARGYNATMKKAVGFSGEDECPECEENVSSFAAFDDLVRANQAAKAKKAADKKAAKDRVYNDIKAGMKHYIDRKDEKRAQDRADVLDARALREQHYQERRADRKENRDLNRAERLQDKANYRADLLNDVKYNRDIEARNYGDSKAKLKADKARNNLAIKFNKAQQKLISANSGEDEAPVIEQEDVVEVCPVCGNNPCTCVHDEDEAAVKQHSYKNVYKYVK